MSIYKFFLNRNKIFLISSVLLLLVSIVLLVVGLNSMISLVNDSTLLASLLVEYSKGFSNVMIPVIFVLFLIPVIFNMIGKTRRNIIKFYGKNTFLGFSAFCILFYSILAFIMLSILLVLSSVGYEDNAFILYGDIIQIEFAMIIYIIILVGFLIVFLNFIQVIRRTDFKYYTKKKKMVNIFLYIFRYIVIVGLIISVIIPINYIYNYVVVTRIYDLFVVTVLIIFIYVCLDYVITFKEKVFL